MQTVLLIAAAVALAFANGANDVFKAVATLYGSRVLSYRVALGVAAASCLLGALTSVVLAQELVKVFSGKGLVPDAVAADPAFALSVGLAAALTILLATAIGFPISTTHALTGALVGAGLAGAADALNLGALGGKFALPLLVSPLLALLLTAAIYPLLRRLRQLLGVNRETWVVLAEVEAPQPAPARVVSEQAAVDLGVAERVATEAGGYELKLSDGHRAVRRYQGRVAGVPAERLLSSAHVLSASAVGFARGLNDTPKIAALLLLLPALSTSLGNALVGLAMVVGGLVFSRKVATTMSERITDMNAGQGFTGNAVSAALITGASHLGVPVSTTHVTCGALFGIGAVTGQARWKTIGSILVAWVTTLPVAALLAAAGYALLS